jgi:hypothetical protein
MTGLDEEKLQRSKPRVAGASTSDMTANGEILVEHLAVGH